MRRNLQLLPLLAIVFSLSAPRASADPWLTYEGGEGPGKGKHVVFIAAESSYRSELSMPLMARILSRHGFTCTVLFAIDPETGTIDPRVTNNIPGLEKLESADLLVAFMRWRQLPDDQMKHIIDYAESGRPIIGIRNATHPFRYPKDSDSPYAKYDWASDDPQGGWGREVLGETWVSHYGKNLVESTECEVINFAASHPIFRGVHRSFWVPDDVYGISEELAGDSEPVLLGQPLTGWNPDDEPNTDKEPLPIAWTKSYTGASGKASRIFTTTTGHGDAFRVEDFRRMLVNACYWCMEMEDQVDPRSDVAMTGTYEPGPAGRQGFKAGVRPDDPSLVDVAPPAEVSGFAMGTFIDDTQPGWRSLTAEDFAKVNSADDTWQWKDGVLHCTGQPVSVLRTAKQYQNFEMVVEWMHEKPAGNSGVFVWVTPESIEKLTAAAKPGLPSGIEVQILDHGFTDMMKARGRTTDWFGTNGDVFAVGVKMTPFPPLSPNGSRSYPRRHMANGHGEWNQYYIRAVNGEVRLWVNGEEVSGGTGCDPAEGYLCLESEGSPIRFRKLRIRELP
ncbi:Trehalose utilization [Maioricimonas rarisocia]|uniref:Trehalose utilization n=1 Tax=Maioricimonas rarisocia TaxID=2528026 RepID=A0A517Z5C2_9PLAN|nr:family 16 glycoside hydrolase [Maioricimonas rarisocia]QDU37664.1 Trehalose utilization [Maioricimonas rarisocia]